MIIYDRSASIGNTEEVIIGNNVWIGDSAMICKGVHIGENAIIGAGAIVVKDIPANAIAAGNPASVIKYLDADKPIRSRSQWMSDPKKMNEYFDAVERIMREKNSLVRVDSIHAVPAQRRLNMRVAIIAAPYPLEEFPSPPLGISYVAAAFEAAGCEVRIFDYIISCYSKEKLAVQLADFQPDAVGAGSVTMNFYDAQRILRDVKSINPDILTMMGGPHVSFTVEETLRTYPEIDLIFIGEADDTIIEFAPLMRQKNKWRGIQGIAYRQDDEIVNNGKRDFIVDVDRIPLPARRLLPISRYRAFGFPVSMITGRGCPHGCIFCLGRKMVGSKVRRRSPQLVLDEIEQIIGLGFDRINIADDLFASDTERVKEICNGIKERNLKFAWSAFARVDTVNQEMFDAMAAAGCDSISFGVESGNPEMLKRVTKGIKLEQATKRRQDVQTVGHAGSRFFYGRVAGRNERDAPRDRRVCQKSWKFFTAIIIWRLFPAQPCAKK